MRITTAHALAATLLSTAVSATLPPIHVKGAKFFTSEGQQWYVKGVAYQRTDGDPFIDVNQCQMDATLMQTLGANALRSYHVDPAANHDACFAIFDAAGIYIFIDLDTYSSAILPEVMPILPKWTAPQMAAFEAVMDSFQKYSNLAGFMIGNEVLNTQGPLTNVAPYIKAATADMKAYRDSKGYRPIPIGYAHADVQGLRPALQNYLTCGSNPAQSIDFFGLNCYEWCGNSGYQQSGYAYLENQTAGYPVPIFMSETGCNQPEPRNFGDQNALFGPMVDTWSGAIIYEWKQESNHYGIITYGGGNTDALDFNEPAGGFAIAGQPTPIVPDFYNLQTVWATNKPTGIAEAAYVPSNTPPPCPAFTAGVWEVNGDVPLPTLGLGVQPSAPVVPAEPSSTSAAVTTPAAVAIPAAAPTSQVSVAAPASTTAPAASIPASVLASSSTTTPTPAAAPIPSSVGPSSGAASVSTTTTVAPAIAPSSPVATPATSQSSVPAGIVVPAFLAPAGGQQSGIQNGAAVEVAQSSSIPPVASISASVAASLSSVIASSAASISRASSSTGAVSSAVIVTTTTARSASAAAAPAASTSSRAGAGGAAELGGMGMWMAGAALWAFGF